MNHNSYRIAIAAMASALLIMLCGCKTPVITHNVAYNLTPHVALASSRETMKQIELNTDIAVLCVGPRSGSNDIAGVSDYHCEKPQSKEILMKNNPLYPVAIHHILQTPEPLGKYVEQSAAAALASKGIRNDSQSSKKVLFQLERFDYDENSDRKKTGPVMMPWQVFSDTDGVLRKGFMDVAVKVVQADGTTSYQRRISVEVTRKRAQTSAAVGIAAVAIGVVSPVTINPEAIRAKEEKTVTKDVLVDLFAKFQDELVADEDLLRAIRK